MKSTKSLFALLLILFVTLSFESNAQTTTNTSWWDTFKSYFVADSPTKEKPQETIQDRPGGTKDTPTPVKDRPTPVKTPTTVKDKPESIKDRPGQNKPAPVKTPTTVKDPVKTRPTQVPVKDRPTNISSSSKAKCGVAGCQHPGKHEGFHKKQDVVRPIMFEKGKGEHKDRDYDHIGGKNQNHDSKGKSQENKGKGKDKSKIKGKKK